jgi:hypothetical protein
MTDMKSEIDTISLPEDSYSPVITEISSKNDLMFEVLLY